MPSLAEVTAALGNIIPKPGVVETATEKTYRASLRFVETVLANAGREDLELEDVPVERRYAHMPKPWKGRKGRMAARGVTTKTKLGKKQQAIELRQQGRTEAQIGEIIDRDIRTVRRYLNGR